MPKAKTKKKEEPKAIPLVDLLRRSMLIKKVTDPFWRQWGTSKKQGSRHYASPSERRAKRKQERNNRKAGRK